MICMSLVAAHDARFFSPRKNPLVGALLRSTFYRQFAAGENEADVQRTVKQMKAQGYTGVILGYAREIVVDSTGRKPQPTDSPTEAEMRDIETWKQDTIRTLRMLSADDILAVK